MTVTIDHATLTLLAQVGLTEVNQIGAVVPVTLRLEGNANAQRLRFALQLIVEVDGRWWQLQAALVSAAWTTDGLLPAPVETLDHVVHSDDAALETALPLTLVCQQPPVALEERQAWLHFLPAQWAAQPTVGSAPDEGEALLGIEQALVTALTQWLDASFPLATLSQAVNTLHAAPVGHFGPVETYVLERSDQADLEVAATLLGTADNSEATGAEASYLVSLYGDRFGRWLLHRRRVKLIKPARKDAPVLRYWQYQVLIAESAAQLIAQAGLEPSEKRLFQAAGLLPPVRFYYAPSEAEGPSVSFSSIDLSGLPDRPRRHLHALVTLAQQGKLEAKDIDLLLRTARHLAS